jgi:hypothetical protein
MLHFFKSLFPETFLTQQALHLYTCNISCIVVPQ